MNFRMPSLLVVGASLAFTLACLGAEDAIRVSGKVTDDKGAGIAGVRVSILGDDKVAATTDASGAFKLTRAELLDPKAAGTRREELTLVSARPEGMVTYTACRVVDENVIVPIDPPSTPKAADAAVPGEISLYLNGRIACVTPTFDDTLPSHIKVVWPLFEEMGYKCTFYINSARLEPGKAGQTTWDDWRKIDKAGFEIGNHAYSHYIKTDENDENTKWNYEQIYKCYDDIKREIGKPPLTFAFPGGGEKEWTQKIVRESPHLDWRNGWHKLKGDRYYPEGDTLTETLLDKYLGDILAHKKIWNNAEPSWFLFYMHDVTEPRAQILRSLLTKIREKDDQIWCAPYGLATQYEKERESSKLEIASIGNRGASVRLTNDLDPKLYNVPVTVSMHVADPDRLSGGHATAYRPAGSTPVEVRCRSGNVLINIVPGKDETLVRWE